jgi:hypothetical protein
MDPATAGLIGVGVGGLCTVASGLGAAWQNNRSARTMSQQAAEERKHASLEAVLDEAALAMETMHWALNDALDARPRDALQPGDAEEWHRSRTRIAEAQANTSRLGTRMAIRLGPPGVSDSVRAYDAKQVRYRALAMQILTTDEPCDPASLRAELDKLGEDKSFFECAAVILKPDALR